MIGPRYAAQFCFKSVYIYNKNRHNKTNSWFYAWVWGHERQVNSTSNRCRNTAAQILSTHLHHFSPTTITTRDKTNPSWQVSGNFIPQIGVFSHSINHGTPWSKHARAHWQERTGLTTLQTWLLTNIYSIKVYNSPSFCVFVELC